MTHFYFTIRTKLLFIKVPISKIIEIQITNLILKISKTFASTPKFKRGFQAYDIFPYIYIGKKIIYINSVYRSILCTYLVLKFLISNENIIVWMMKELPGSKFHKSRQKISLMRVKFSLKSLLMSDHLSLS